ncbi:MAG: phenylalanine--tRNA ligase subunit beta [Candidatus Omnitrophica bacterium]|nr:phenylalanine--tRNA ligase subunit beta [Candidatus Omnitrophota bacterium]MDD5351589.1 phenylalanine--tRNA ligase subunit beta [Candidatus Omnitrophota bacterium]MDD5551024.1 phenylalanine--tRNA ligase subunit beta [Candidatus Omnitrophota bacterium]
MKFSYNWLKDYVQIKVSPKVLAEKLTMAGLEVGSWHQDNNDVVFEAEVTANRSDCLSILGIAQEAAAITNSRLKIPSPKVKPRPNKSKKYLKSDFISIQNKKDCAFYRGCLIVDVKVGQSPQWLRQRVESLGMRSVNNIVDITNYCLLEYGQPLHAFDYNKITEQIVVRRAKKGEKILNIDGVERKLDENILVISDKNKAIAIAGIMGDKLSEVSPQTKNILLESAYFQPLLIRRASRQLGVSTDSSYRFERQVDFARVIQAQNRAIDLICEIAGGKFVDEKTEGKKLSSPSQQIRFDCAKANNFLCLDISTDKIKQIFTSLGFSCKKLTKDILSVRIPALRRDIKIEEDLSEELSRIYGYDKIASTAPAIRSARIENSPVEMLKPEMRGLLCALGFNETINYSLISKDMIESSCSGQDAVRLENPLSSEQECLRPGLVAGLLNCLAYNLNHKNTDLKLFELGHVFTGDYSEDLCLGLIATGKLVDSWQIKKEFDIFSLKGDIENFISRMGFGEVKFIASEGNNLFSQGEAAKIVCQGREVGIQGRIDNRVLSNFGIKNPSPVFYTEIFIKDLYQCRKDKKKFMPLPVFPSIIRDMSLIVKSSVQYEEIVDVIRQEAGEYLKAVKLIDKYKGEQIAAGCIGLTISLEFALADRTLKDEEAGDLQQRITRRLNKELAVQIR